MATMIQAMAKLSPRLELGPVVEMDELCAILTARTGLKRSQVQLALTELHEVTRDLARRGRPVKLPGLGVFTPALKITGRVHLGCRLDRTLNRALAADYAGKISDRRRLKWGPEEYRAFWNEAHPDDPVPAEEAARYQARHAVAKARDERHQRGFMDQGYRRKPRLAAATARVAQVEEPGTVDAAAEDTGPAASAG